MNAFLMYRDHDFDSSQELPSHASALIQDLELDTLFNAMALGDQFLFEVAKNAVLTGWNNDLDTIRYRQDILKDCLKNPSIVREIYNIAVATIERKKKDHWWGGTFSRYPSSILYSSLSMLEMFVEMLEKLRKVADKHAVHFESEGFTTFFTMLRKELDDEYFATVHNHIKELKFDNGVLIGAELGEGNKGTNYLLHKPHDKKESWIKRVFARKPTAHTFTIDERDENGAKALSELRDRGINLVANAIAQSADHILSFCTLLRVELAFYINCLNLHGQLAKMGEPICFPLPAPHCEHRLSCQGLYDVCLALTMNHKIVGNDVNGFNKSLVIITGANQGGKSTFLRSIGLSQLMMQCGMFVPAVSFYANVCTGLFTHFKREEDATMESGKFDEELSRMNNIADKITSHSIVLFNESFAVTNEREGSEIARQIVYALLEKHIKIYFVTHLYEFAHSLYEIRMENILFLRSERQADGIRTFKLREAEPLQTSFGEDLYNKIFGTGNNEGCEDVANVVA